MGYSASGIRLHQTVIGWDTAARLRLSSGEAVTRFTLLLTAERLAKLRAARLPWLLEGVGGPDTTLEGELLVVDVIDDGRWVDRIA